MVRNHCPRVWNIHHIYCDSHNVEFLVERLALLDEHRLRSWTPKNRQRSLHVSVLFDKHPYWLCWVHLWNSIANLRILLKGTCLALHFCYFFNDVLAMLYEDYSNVPETIPISSRYNAYLLLRVVGLSKCNINQSYHTSHKSISWLRIQQKT